MTNAVEVRYVARLVTLCGCTREMATSTPLPLALRIALRPDPAIALSLDDTALHALFEDEPVATRVFYKHHVERPRPELVVAVYMEENANVKGGKGGR